MNAEINILNMLAAGESETIEFKASFNDEAIETIGAFMNAKGGMLLLGIKDSGIICGFNVGKKTLEDIANRIQEATDPRIQPSVSTTRNEGKTVVIISVASSAGTPISVRGKYFRRVGKTNQRMSHAEIIQRIIANSSNSWDSCIEQNANLNDLNLENIRHFVDMVKRSGRHPFPDNVSQFDFLRKIKLIIDDKPTRASILLFSDDPEKYFGSAFLKLGRFRSPTLIVDDREMHGTLLNQLDGTMAWFRERLETAFIITGNPQREVIWEYPLDALREAVVNLLCHRDYTSDAHSQIRLYDKHLEFWNAGTLPSGLTTDMLLVEHDSKPRNKKIAEAFFYMGLIERWGSGTTRIAKELQAYKHPLPKFKSEVGTFRLYFYRAITDNYQLIEQPVLNLTERQLKAVEYVKQHGNISNSEYQKVARVSSRTATRELTNLKEKNVLISEGSKGRGVIYKLKS